MTGHTKRAALTAVGLSLAAGGGGQAWSAPLTGDAGRASRAQAAIAELDVAAARDILTGVDPADGLLALERGRLALYDGDCDGAVSVLSRPELAGTTEGAELLQIARGCARGT